MGPGGAVWGKKRNYKISRETVPLKGQSRGNFELCFNVLETHCGQNLFKIESLETLTNVRFLSFLEEKNVNKCL